MNDKIAHTHPSKIADNKKAPIAMRLNDFLLTHLLLSPTPLVAVSKAIMGGESPADHTLTPVECFVVNVPWKREC
jgi:hypothetical protein